MRECLNCKGDLEANRLTCQACDLHYEGTFCTPRLARLAPEHQYLAEQVVLAAGNLKQVAGEIEVSYPTLRKRLDRLIAALQELRTQDDRRVTGLLGAVESGEMSAEAAARLIREIHGQA